MTDQDKAIRSALLTAKRAAGGQIERNLLGDVHINPSAAALKGISEKGPTGSVRGVTSGGKTYTRDAYGATHVPMMHMLGIDPQDAEVRRHYWNPADLQAGGYDIRKLTGAKRAAGGQIDPPQPRRQFVGSNMYSHAAEAAQALPQAKGQPQQMLASLKGVKPEEIANSGAAQAFAGQPSVTREQLAQHFHKSAPRIMERNLGDYDGGGGPESKFEEHTIPGGKNYRELLLHTPPDRNTLERHKVMRPDGHVDATYANRAGAEARAQQIGGQVQTAAPTVIEGGFRSSHWDTPNVLAHLRMSDRRVPNGKTPETDQKISDETMPGTPERRARLVEQERAKKGDKVLHLEELQSDWGQAGREKGFKEPVSPELEAKAMGVANDSLLPNRKYLPGFADKGIVTREDIRALRPEQISFWEKTGAVSPEQAAVLKEHEEAVSKEHTGVPKGPYVTSTNGWTDLGLKRALTEAARGKYDRLAWTPGQEQGERYGLAKKLSHLAYHPGVQRLLGTEHGASHPAIEENDVTPEKLPSYVGKELAERLLASEKDASGAHSVTGDDLKVGGEGMKGYYDKILPGRLKEILKKLGHEAKFEPLTIKHPKDDAGRTEHTLHSVPLPLDLREKILKGLPAYAAGGSIVDHALRLTAPPAKAYKA